MNSVLPSGPPSMQANPAAVELDGVQHLAALADPHAVAVRHVGVPDGALGIQADAVGVLAGVAPTPAGSESAPSAAMSNAVSCSAHDSATISVRSSGVTTMPLGNASPSATWRTEPSGVTSAMTPDGPAGSPKSPPLT